MPSLPTQASTEPRVPQSRAAYRIGRELGRLLAVARRVPVPSPWLVLPLLVVANRLVIVEAARIAVHRGWLYYDGGDSTWYYTSAWVLGHGHIPQSSIGYGYSLLIAPIALLAGSNLFAGLPYVLVLNAVVLAPIALLCVYGLARAIGGLRFAYATALVWVVVPLVAIRYFLPDYHARYVDIALPSWVGLTALGDFPSMVCLLVAAYFGYRALGSGSDTDTLAAGLAAGIAIGVKPANALILPAAFVALALTRRPRQLVVLSAGLAPSLLALALWKYRGLGDLPAISAQQAVLAAGARGVPPLASFPIHLGNYLHFDWTNFQHNLDGFREWGWSKRLIEWLPIAGLIGLARRSLTGAVFIGGWFASYLILKGGDPIITVEAGNFLTHMIPAAPAFIILASCVVFCIPVYGRRALPAPAVSSWPRSERSQRHVLALLAFLAVVPIGVFLILPPLGSGQTADLGTYDVFVPASHFPLSARVQAGTVTLGWPPQPTNGTQSGYIVFRSPASPPAYDCVPQAHAATQCTFGATTLGVVPASSPSYRDHPGAGQWDYWVALAATASGPAAGDDPVLLSSPAAVNVR